MNYFQSQRDVLLGPDFTGHNIGQQRGFSFIELILVIVVLGVLSVFVLPRFTDVPSQARVTALEGMAGAIHSAIIVQHAIALVNQDEGGLDNGFVANGILFDQGYPVALDFDIPFGAFNVDNDPDDIPEILEAIDLDLSGWTTGEVIRGSEGGQRTRKLYMTLSDIVDNGASANEIAASDCYVSYDSFLRIRRRPIVRVVSTGC